MMHQRRNSSVVPIQQDCCNGLGGPQTSVSVRYGAEVVSSRSKNSKQFKPLVKLMNVLVKLVTPSVEDTARREYLHALAKINFLGYDGADESNSRQWKFRDCDRETHTMLVDLERSRLNEFTTLRIHC